MAYEHKLLSHFREPGNKEREILVFSWLFPLSLYPVWGSSHRMLPPTLKAGTSPLNNLLWKRHEIVDCINALVVPCSSQVDNQNSPP